MKRRIKVFGLVLTILQIVLIGFGCKNELHEVEFSPARLACIELMQQVPIHYDYFEFWDVGALREDPDLEDMYQELNVHFLERYGIASQDIDYMAHGEGLEIFILDYDIDAFRDRISPDFNQDTSHKDIEVWKSEPSYDTEDLMLLGGWVLTEGLLIRGTNNYNVDDYLRVIRGEELSMYDKNAAALLERLPQGVTNSISRYSQSKSPIIRGVSVEKERNDTFRWINVDMFENAEAANTTEANESYQKIEDSFNEILAQLGDSSPLHDFSLDRESNFVRWSVLAELQYMITLLFYG